MIDEDRLDEQRRAAGRAICEWSHELANRFSPGDAWRILLAGAVAALGKAEGAHGAAQILRELADDLDPAKAVN